MSKTKDEQIHEANEAYLAKIAEIEAQFEENSKTIKNTKWIIYDSRYWVDQDIAEVMEICDTKEEAEKNKNNYGSDCAVVETDYN